MTFEFKFPDVGEGITEGEVVRWHIREGDFVKEDEVLAEIETDKAVVEIPSPKTGKILKLHFKEGETVDVGSVLVTFDDANESSIKKDVRNDADTKKPYKSTGVVGSLEDADEEEVKEVSKVRQSSSSEIKALPSVRKLARDIGVDLSIVTGTGNGGMITESDVRNFKGSDENNAGKEPKVKVVKKYDMYGYVDRINYRGIRKTIGENMINSQSKTASVTHHDEADVTDLWEHRNKEKLFAQEKGIKLTLLPFIVKALINSLKKHPILNSTLDEEDRENPEIIVKKYYNIGIAVDTEVGLIVPVIKIADKKSILDLANEINSLAEKTKQRKLDIADMKGGTFTITNYGSIGGYHATPIINYPECAILGIGRMVDRPRIIGDKMMLRKILPLSITFDHRITDGAECARFSNDLISYLEDPDMLMLDG